jgi:Domain of unknown function (DUF1918)
MASPEREASIRSSSTKEVVMSETKQTETGDLIVIHGHRVGEPEKTGEILEVLGEPGRFHYRVLWEDGRVSLFYPAGDVSVRHTAKGARR